MFRSIAIAIISFVIIFGLGEFLSSIWLQKYGNALDITRKILMADDTLGWKQRANLDTQFLGEHLTTNELGLRANSLTSTDKSKKIILILGPSSAFGWGVDDNHTYSSLLQQLLEKAKKEVKVVNAGVIGYTIVQGKRLYAIEEISSLDPDIVIIAYGINELDRHRFFSQSSESDKEFFSSTKNFNIQLYTQPLFSSSLGISLFKIANWLRTSLQSPVANLYTPVKPVRVPLEDFKLDIGDLVNSVCSNNKPVILLTTAVNLPITAAQSSKELEILRVLYKRGKVAYDNRDLNLAEAIFSEVISAYPHESNAYYYLSALAMMKENKNQAEILFDKAVENEPHRIAKDVRHYNEFLRSISKEDCVLLGDIPLWFEKEEYEELFLDPVHFSEMGNQLVAENIGRIIIENNLMRDHAGTP